jgi:FtsP/CotA-like multicopper oxidase with cupredoxin domain
VAIASRGVGSQIVRSSSTATAQHLAHEHHSSLPVEEAILLKAPHVPPPVNRDYPVLLKVALETTTKVMQLTNRLKYEFWTFNDVVPGPLIRGRVGDVVELTLKNTDKTGNPHNIDCHGFEGPGGGAPITTAQQDETKVARFKLLYPGLYVYHCAAAPVPAHIMNGMYGLCLVEPEYNTLPPVDKEYYGQRRSYRHGRREPQAQGPVVARASTPPVLSALFLTLSSVCVFFSLPCP